MISEREDLRRAVRQAVKAAPAADAFTRLSKVSLAMDSAQAVDTLLTTPDLLREAALYGDERLASTDKRERANAVFQRLFVERSPVSLAAQAALWSLEKLRLPLGERTLTSIRRDMASRRAEDRVLDALDIAGLSKVAVPCCVFDEEPWSLGDYEGRLYPSICVDALADTSLAWPRLAVLGCKRVQDVQALLQKKAETLGAGSLAVTAPFEGPLWEQAVLPALWALRLPLVVIGELTTAPPDEAALLGRIAREGLSFLPYASGALVPEQLPGLWHIARRSIAEALTNAYQPLLKTGWQPTVAEISHDIEQFLSQKGKNVIPMEAYFQYNSFD